MATYSTPRQVRFQYRKAMGPTLGPLFHELSDDCSWLHIRWAQYVHLYGSSQSRVDLLNESAPFFFKIVEDCLWADVLINLCRLTDRPIIAGRANLTLLQLPDLMATKRLSQAVARRARRAVTATTFARDWRNRHLVHSDLRHSLSPHSRPLAKASRLRVKTALRAIVDCLNHVQLYYCDATMNYGPFGDPRDAEALLYLIRDGLGVESTRRTRLQSGVPLPDDLRPLPAV
jgi:AbiU2